MTLTTTEDNAKPTPSIFAADPRLVLATATDIAKTLGQAIADRHLVVTIGKREHVLIEGWTLLGSMVGVFAEVEYTRPMLDTDGRSLGWEARAVAKTIDGRTISAAEAMCGRDEYAWRNRDDYALRSMAQTRAVSKALRLPLGFIVELAGFSATPAEELGAGGGESPPPSSAPSRITPSAEAAGLRVAIESLREARGLSTDDLAALAREHGVREGTKATLAQLRAIHDRLMLTGQLDTDQDLPDIVETPTDDTQPNGDTNTEG